MTAKAQPQVKFPDRAASPSGLNIAFGDVEFSEGEWTIEVLTNATEATVKVSIYRDFGGRFFAQSVPFPGRYNTIQYRDVYLPKEVSVE